MKLANMDIENIKLEWNTVGSKYASDVNKMVEFGDTNGWENWKGPEPKDDRDHLSDAVFELLKEANLNNTVSQFREDFPPAHGPMVNFMKTKGQSIEQLHFIEEQKILFVVGTAYTKRQAYILKGKMVIELDAAINAIGKSKKNNVFAIASNNAIVTTQGWEGTIIAQFNLDITKDFGITELIPFNDGEKVLLITSEGIFIISTESEKMIHPLPDLEDEEWESNIDMENATLSHDNNYIVVGDQCCEHRILDHNGVEIADVELQSSYPHFCLFSKDDQQLISNSCHFYNGVTLGIATSDLENGTVNTNVDYDPYTLIDDGMRVYCGVATSQYYILGDAYGYIKAIDTMGKCIWKQFLGSTISGMTVSDDEDVLWVGSSSGMLHKLILNKGLRDKHTIGTAKHYEEFRLVIWKEEPIMKW
jgi:hypothetical protein